MAFTLICAATLAFFLAYYLSNMRNRMARLEEQMEALNGFIEALAQGRVAAMPEKPEDAPAPILTRADDHIGIVHGHAGDCPPPSLPPPHEPITAVKKLQQMDMVLRAANEEQPAGPVPPAEPIPPAEVPPVAAQISTEDIPAAIEEAPEAIAEPAAAMPSWEERLGSRWAVWLGGLALGLGGLFLARYSIEQGYFGPGVRTIMGLMLGLALIGAGEFFRRSDERRNLAGIAAAHIPSVLTAAGATTLFGVTYAAHAIYGFIGPATAFATFGAIGLLTIFASLLHGQALAGFGLLGAMAGPLLVGSSGSSKTPLVVYLAIVVASACFLSHWRRWPWLQRASAVAAILWDVVLTIIDPNPAYAHALVQAALASAMLAVSPRGFSERRIDWQASLILTAFAALLLASVLLNHPEPAILRLVLSLCAAILGCAGLWRRRGAPAVTGAGITLLALFLLWPGTARFISFERLGDITLLLPGAPENETAFLVWCAIAIAAALTLPVLRMLARSRLYRVLTRLQILCWLGTAIIMPLALVLIMWTRIAALDRSITMAGFAGMLCLGFTAATIRAVRAGTLRHASGRIVPESLAAGAAIIFAFGLTMLLAQGWLTVSFALAALGIAFVTTWFGSYSLRWAVGGSSAIVLGRLILHPAVMDSGVGATPIFNWLIVGYGIPAACFAACWWLMAKKEPEHWTTRLSLAVSIVLTALFATFELRHLLNDGDPFARTSALMEQGLMTTLSLSFSLAMTAFDRRRSDIVLRYGSIIFALASVAFSIAGLAFVKNPLLSGELVRGPVFFNSLVLGYLLPGLMALIVVWRGYRVRPRLVIAAIGWLGAILLFTYAGLALRHAFLGADIAWGQAVLLTQSGLLATIAALFVSGLNLWEKRSPKSAPPRATFASCLVFGLLAAFNLSPSQNPLFGGEVIRGPLFFNMLVPGYLLPALAAILFMARQNHSRFRLAVNVMGWAAIGGLYAYLGMTLRQALTGGDISISSGSSLVETGLLTALTLLFACGLQMLRRARRWPLPLFAVGTACGASIAIAVLGPFEMQNPLLWSSITIKGVPLFNTLTVGYLLPCLAALLFLSRLGGRRHTAKAQGISWLAAILAFVFVTYNLRYLQLGPDISFGRGFHLVGSGFTATLAFLFATALHTLERKWLAARSWPVPGFGDKAFLMLGIVVLTAGPLALYNPLWPHSDPVSGWPVFNSLIFAYPVPLAALALAARRMKKELPRMVLPGLGGLAVLVMFAYATLLVRQAFAGAAMGLHAMPRGGELWAYSVAWLALGLILLAIGFLRQRAEARLVSAPFIVAAVLKVFLIDMSGLSGLWRPLSFIGLGLALIGIGLVYQKLLLAGKKAGKAALIPPAP